MKRPMMNALKQKWKEFSKWIIESQGYSNLHIEKCEMKFTTYYKTNRRHDVDAACPKFILDGFAESGFIIDGIVAIGALFLLYTFIDNRYCLKKSGAVIMLIGYIAYFISVL